MRKRGRILFFALRVFHVPGKTIEKRVSLAKAVKPNLRDAAPEVVQARKAKKPKKAEDEPRKSIERKLKEKHIRCGPHASLRRRHSEAFRKNQDLLQPEHFRSSEDREYSDELERMERQSFTAAEVKEYIRTFSKGSAGGIDSFRPQHFEVLLSLQNKSSKQFLFVMSDLMNYLMLRRTQDPIRRILYGATLTPLLKMNVKELPTSQHILASGGEDGQQTSIDRDGRSNSAKITELRHKR